MTERSTEHTTFVIERSYAASPARVFAAWADPVPCPTVAALHRAQAAVDRRLVAWCSALDENGPDRIIEVHRGIGMQRERADRLLLHLFQHQIHHRGQAHAMLSGTPVAPEVYAELLRSYDDGVAEFLDLDRVKPNTLGNTRMLLRL